MNRLGREDGFTLIEMLVAGIVLAVGIGATITVLVGSGKAGTAAERHNVGIEQGQQAIEQVRALPYAAVGLNAAPPAPQGATDPTNRVTGTTFNPVGSVQEDLVLPGDSKVPSPQVAPFSTVSVGSGGTATTAKVYRFVSWRSETCTLLPASALGIVLGNSGNGNGAVSVLNGLLESLTNNQLITRLQTLVANINGSQAGVGGLLNVLLSTVLNAANGIIAKGDDLEPAAQALLTTLQTTVNEIANLNGALESLGDISLCNLDLSVLLSFKERLDDLVTSGSTGLFDSNNSIGSSITAVSDLFDDVTNVNCGLLNLQCLLGNAVGNLLVITNNTLASLEPTLKNTLTSANSVQLTDIRDAIAGLAADVAEFAASATSPTRKSSKRVVVAVVLDPAGPVGPKAPIWMSTVVTDPKAGLLG